MTLKTENRSLSQETRLNTPMEFLFARAQRLPNTKRSRAHSLLCKQVQQERAGGDTREPVRDAPPRPRSKQKQAYPTTSLGALPSAGQLHVPSTQLSQWRASSNPFKLEKTSDALHRPVSVADGPALGEKGTSTDSPAPAAPRACRPGCRPVPVPRGHGRQRRSPRGSGGRHGRRKGALPTDSLTCSQSLVDGAQRLSEAALGQQLLQSSPGPRPLALAREPLLRQPVEDNAGAQRGRGRAGAPRRQQPVPAAAAAGPQLPAEAAAAIGVPARDGHRLAQEPPAAAAAQRPLGPALPAPARPLPQAVVQHQAVHEGPEALGSAEGAEAQRRQGRAYRFFQAARGHQPRQQQLPLFVRSLAGAPAAARLRRQLRAHGGGGRGRCHRLRGCGEGGVALPLRTPGWVPGWARAGGGRRRGEVTKHRSTRAPPTARGHVGGTGRARPGTPEPRGGGAPEPPRPARHRGGGSAPAGPRVAGRARGTALRVDS